MSDKPVFASPPARSTRSRLASLLTEIRKPVAKPASVLVCVDVMFTSLNHYFC